MVEHLRHSPLRRIGRHEPKAKAEVCAVAPAKLTGPYLTGKSFADVAYRRSNIGEIIVEADAKKHQHHKVSMSGAHEVQTGVTATVVLHVEGTR